MIDGLTKFFKTHWDQRSPLLLGYSGGSDSKALLYALLEIGIKPHLAHVDHGWREVSEAEAKELSLEAEKLGLFFHTKRLKTEGEDAARRGRIAFFQELFTKIPFQALLLAHHERDLAETVMKRIFEGAHLSYLGGMQEIAILEGISLWRPLLFEKKKKILDFLEDRKLKAIQDATNYDPKYLRSRMRLEIFPFLNQLFGKEIEENLSILSVRAFEIKEYLTKKTLAHTGPLSDLERIEARHLLLELAKKKGATMTRVILERTLDAIYSKAENVRITDSVLVNAGYVIFKPFKERILC